MCQCCRYFEIGSKLSNSDLWIWLKLQTQIPFLIEKLVGCYLFNKEFEMNVFLLHLSNPSWQTIKFYRGKELNTRSGLRSDWVLRWTSDQSAPLVGLHGWQDEIGFLLSSNFCLSIKIRLIFVVYEEMMVNCLNCATQITVWLFFSHANMIIFFIAPQRAAVVPVAALPPIAQTSGIWALPSWTGGDWIGEPR